MSKDTTITSTPLETPRLPAPDAQPLTAHASEYSEEGFWHKVSSVARKAGQAALNPALRMYFAAQDSDTPVWARTTIYGALGYFISPIDALPDFTPLLGYTDDITLMAGAVAIVAAHIKPEHRARADKVLKRWFD